MFEWFQISMITLNVVSLVKMHPTVGSSQIGVMKSYYNIQRVQNWWLWPLSLWGRKWDNWTCPATCQNTRNIISPARDNQQTTLQSPTYCLLHWEIRRNCLTTNAKEKKIIKQLTMWDIHFWWTPLVWNTSLTCKYKLLSFPW